MIKAIKNPTTEMGEFAVHKKKLESLSASNATTCYAIVGAERNSGGQLILEVLDHPAVFYLGAEKDQFRVGANSQRVPGRPVE